METNELVEFNKELRKVIYDKAKELSDKCGGSVDSFYMPELQVKVGSDGIRIDFQTMVMIKI